MGLDRISPTCSDALAGQQHDSGQAHAKNGTLAEVEHGERGGGFQRGRLVGLQEAVVALGFVLLVVEVLQPGNGVGRWERGHGGGNGKVGKKTATREEKKNESNTKINLEGGFKVEIARRAGRVR